MMLKMLKWKDLRIKKRPAEFFVAFIPIKSKFPLRCHRARQVNWLRRHCSHPIGYVSSTNNIGDGDQKSDALMCFVVPSIKVSEQIFGIIFSLNKIVFLLQLGSDESHLNPTESKTSNL